LNFRKMKIFLVTSQCPRRLFSFLLAATLILFSLCLRGILIINFYRIDWQIGHLISMTHSNERRNMEWNKCHKRKKLTVYCVAGPIANSYLLEKLREHIFITSGRLASMLNFLTRPFSWIHIYNSNDANFRDYIFANRLVTFTKDELSLGETFTGKNSRKFVCLNVRDSGYNSMVRSEYGRNAKDWTQRNSDVETYRDACRILTLKGTNVYRMGIQVEEKFGKNDDSIFDYATDGTRTEFLDLYLGSRCKFAISTSSGWDEIPFMFTRPVLLTNCADFLKISNLTGTCVIYPKIIMSTVTDNIVSLDKALDLFQNGIRFLNNVNLDNFGVKTRDLSSEELVEAVTEMAQRVEGTFVETPEQKEMQAKLKRILSTHPKLQPSPNYYPIRAQFASCFLSRYPNFLDGLE
jgi:putative glycosyltransferase (TIGR04372 family)